MAGRGNCFIVALLILWRLRRYTGRNAVVWWARRSDHIWGAHWGVETRDRRHVWHYSPLRPASLPRALWDKLWYIGRLHWGDKPTE